ncbi:class I SAM-dependent methyltransferase [Rhizobium sp. TH135]|uniref:class I SAM-dependent methyltransferase n=1 Tax=Rhizobium sp. TH135 TaxID=2067451 RepID=UPI001558EE6D|nr:class I SAM-dependent methyltransferase [Rhizobium sp. TH135]
MGQQAVYLEYAYDFQRRWGQNGHPQLVDLIGSNEANFKANLKEMAQLHSLIAAFNNSGNPNLDFDNSFMPVLDGLSVAWAAARAHKVYLEIGSGFSTIYARAGIDQAKAKVSIISIDPRPRAEIDKLCDESIRSPLERVDLALFEKLEAGDTVFFDGSHRSFTNSDVTIFFTEVLPRLQAGVLVGIHDIFLPFDYPESWRARAYNEQYLLATLLLANPSYFNMQLCNHWIGTRGLHRNSLDKIWNIAGTKAKERAGSAWWGTKN